MRSEQLQEEANQQNPYPWLVEVHCLTFMAVASGESHVALGRAGQTGTPDNDPMPLAFSLRASYSEASPYWGVTVADGLVLLCPPVQRRHTAGSAAPTCRQSAG
jgi:hypothetical protein